jgi:WD40 repeat protein
MAGRVTLWDVEASVAAGAGVELYALPDYRDGRVKDVTLSPGGTRLAWATWQMVELRDLDQASPRADQQEALSLCCHDRWVSEVAFSQDETRLATASEDGTAKVWDAESGELLLTLEGHTDYVYGVTFSPDGRLLATGGTDKTARVWDLDTGEALHTLRGHEGSVHELAFGPGATLLATGDSVGVVRVWDLQRAEEPLILQSHTDDVKALAFSPGGRFLVTAGLDGRARIWDLTAADPQEAQCTLLGHKGSIEAIAFSPDATLVATGGADRSARVWDLASGQEMFTLLDHKAGVRDLAFTPDGTHILACSQREDGEDSRVLVHTLDVEELKTLACQRVSRNLSQDEWQAYVSPDLPYRETCPGLPVPP